MIIDVYSDVVCPWCYIGKARLGKALRRPEVGSDVEVCWRAYQLYPGIPVEGMDRDEFSRLRWGTDDPRRLRNGARPKHGPRACPWNSVRRGACPTPGAHTAWPCTPIRWAYRTP